MWTDPVRRLDMTMMDTPLNSWLLFDHAPRHFADTEVVTRFESGDVHRCTYADFGARTQQLMHGLDKLRLDRGVPVATLAWNTFRHLECYFGVPCTGRILHTLNLRLSPEDLAYIIGHAGDKAILVDPDMLPILEKVGDLPTVEHVIVLGGEVPDTSIEGVVAYEDLIADEAETYQRFYIPEDAPL